MMKELLAKIQSEATYLGSGIIKVDSFINHKVDVALMHSIGLNFARQFSELGITDIDKIVTAEVSGILPALTTAQVLNIPMIYARKRHSATMTDEYYQAKAESRTKGDTVALMVSKNYLLSNDRVLLIDDFLATGSTISALVDIIQQSGAFLRGIGCIIEKPIEGGRECLYQFDVPIITLAKLGFDQHTIKIL